MTKLSESASALAGSAQHDAGQPLVDTSFLEQLPRDQLLQKTKEYWSSLQGHTCKYYPPVTVAIPNIGLILLMLQSLGIYSEMEGESPI